MKSEDRGTTLQDFLARPYPIIVKEAQKEFQIFAPKLHIFVAAPSLESAYELYQKEKTTFYQKLESIDALHLLPDISEERSLFKRIDLQKIAIERSISFALTLIFLVIVLSVAIHQVNKSSSKMNAAFAPADPAKKEERLQKFREKLEVIAPYVKEMKKAFNE